MEVEFELDLDELVELCILWVRSEQVDRELSDSCCPTTESMENEQGMHRAAQSESERAHFLEWKVKQKKKKKKMNSLLLEIKTVSV